MNNEQDVGHINVSHVHNCANLRIAKLCRWYVRTAVYVTATHCINVSDYYRLCCCSLSHGARLTFSDQHRRRNDSKVVYGQKSKLRKHRQRLVWRSGNGVRHINEVKLRRARLVLGLVKNEDHWRVYHSGIFIQAMHPGPLSLAIPPLAGATSTGDGFGHIWEETAPLKLRPYGAL